MPRPSWKQLDLPFAKIGEKRHDLNELEIHSQRIAGYLSIRMPEPVDVIFNDNKSTMVSFKSRGGRLIVRLHRLFRHADNEVLDSLALFLGKQDKISSKALDRFIASHRDEIRIQAPRKKRPVRQKGSFHDLDAVLKRVNKAYFEGRIDVNIGWGRSPSRRRKRYTKSVSRALATYSYEDKIIRVSPVLDSQNVPDYMLDWVVYHELLHHVLPVEEKGNKRRYHTQRFKLLERAFDRYEEAKSWEKAHLDRLLS